MLMFVAGSVTVYYSNKDYRAYAGLYDIYSNPSKYVMTSG